MFYIMYKTQNIGIYLCIYLKQSIKRNSLLLSFVHAGCRVIQISIQWSNVIIEDKGYQISSQEGLTCLQIVKFAQTNFSFVQKSFCCFNWISNLTEDIDVINFDAKLVPQS